MVGYNVDIMASIERLEAQEHYHYVTKSIVRLFNAGALTNVRDIAVEPLYGHTSRIEYADGSYRITYGNDLGVNPGSANSLAKDKGHSKFILRSMGVNCPEGREFLMPWWAEEISAGPNAQQADKIPEYIESLIGYPAYIKPVSGSHGSGVHTVEDTSEIYEILDEYSRKRVRVAVAEEAIDMPDYRIVTLDDEVISAYERQPLAITGNGRDTVRQLINKVEAHYHQQGRDIRIDQNDARIIKQLGQVGLKPENILKDNLTVPLHKISNLSAGGTSVDITEILHPRWADLAAKIARSFNLRLCGLDLACEDVGGGSGQYSVIEVNATPGLEHYANSGDLQRQIVDNLYVRVVNHPQL